MLRLLRNKKAQSTLEYAIMIAVVVAALITMQTYFKRGVAGKMRESTDQIGDQFSPGRTTYNYTTGITSNATEDITLGADGRPRTVSSVAQTQERSGSETVQGLDQEIWPE